MPRSFPLEPRAAWRTAFEKAVDRDDADICRFAWSADNGDHSVNVFEVLSWSEADQRHKVEVRLFDAGDVDAKCSCPAGYSGNRCWHQAAALLTLGLLTNADVSLDDEPELILTTADLEAEAAYQAELDRQLDWERFVVAGAEALAIEYALDEAAAL